MAFVYVADQEYNSGCLDSDGADAFLYEKIRSSFFVDVQGIILNVQVMNHNILMEFCRIKWNKHMQFIQVHWLLFIVC